MIILNIELNNIYGFNDFKMNLTYPKKIVNSIIEDEHLAGRERFRYKKAVVLMGANASGKTSLGKALRNIFAMMELDFRVDPYSMVNNKNPGSFCIDFVNEDYVLRRVEGRIDSKIKLATYHYYRAAIDKNDSYETCVRKLVRDNEYEGHMIRSRFAYPDISPELRFEGVNEKTMLKTLKAVIGTLDPTLKNIVRSKDLKDSYIIKRDDQEIIIQNGKLLNTQVLSSGTAEGIEVAIMLASIIDGKETFYYCDEHFSYIHSDIEKRIFGIMLEHLGDNEQLIFTTHNTDMLDLNLPKHSYCFLKKEKVGNRYEVSVRYASDYLKRNTDSVRCAVENDLFGSIPDDSLLDSLEIDS